jgi:hypothetical protein
MQSSPGPDRSRREKRRDFANILMKRRQASCLKGLETSLANDIRTLPVLAAIQRHQNLPGAKSSQDLIRIGGLSRYAHPQHIDRSA